MIQDILKPKLISWLEKYILPTLVIYMIFSLFLGLYLALSASPPDYQQGEMVRVMYVHVPAAWMSLGIYCFIGSCSISVLVWRNRLAYILAVSSSPIGASFALITLITGSIWGKPIWGTWWVWDARLTSMLVLFLLYLSYIIIIKSSDNLLRAEKPASVIAIIGLVNVPIVKFSVDIWYSLHQPASIIRKGGPAIHSSMLWPLLIMFSCFVAYFLTFTIMRSRIILRKLKKERE